MVAGGSGWPDDGLQLCCLVGVTSLASSSSHLFPVTMGIAGDGARSDDAGAL